ncbi:sodium:solute symporter family transporter [Salinicoccus carnicancri]|uniref:sodium:solute symporter family transporter n=1 Tax=Salinicoccus carnicancri TaxID=558170 RepID=UPI00247FD3CB|nr:hypothetical protein [Salinicoccus carnicancri]
MEQITLYTWIGFIAFLLLMLVVGYLSARRMKTIADFATGGGKLGPYVLGLSFAATYLSAATFLGYPGWSYEWGFSNLWLFIAIIFGGPAGVLMVAKKIRKLNTTQKSISLPDWLGGLLPERCAACRHSPHTAVQYILYRRTVRRRCQDL